MTQEARLIAVKRDLLSKQERTEVDVISYLLRRCEKGHSIYVKINIIV